MPACSRLKRFRSFALRFFSRRGSFPPVSACAQLATPRSTTDGPYFKFLAAPRHDVARRAQGVATDQTWRRRTGFGACRKAHPGARNAPRFPGDEREIVLGADDRHQAAPLEDFFARARSIRFSVVFPSDHSEALAAGPGRYAASSFPNILWPNPIAPNPSR
jgi:hypothetical protein